MKRVPLVLLTCLVLIPTVTFAQGEPGWNKMSLGASIEVSAPAGDFASIAGIGYGGNARYQFGVEPRGVLTATAGYLVWSEEDLEGDRSIQPKAFNIFVGGKYYLADGFYGSLEGGLYFLSYTRTGPAVDVEGNNTRFMLPIGVGFQKSGFEVGARYMLLDVDFNAFSFTVGYNFSL